MYEPLYDPFKTYQLYGMYPNLDISVVRCPGHTIHFLRYGYAEYIKTVLGFLNINPSLIDWNKYDTWNPYD